MKTKILSCLTGSAFFVRALCSLCLAAMMTIGSCLHRHRVLSDRLFTVITAWTLMTSKQIWFFQKGASTKSWLRSRISCRVSACPGLCWHGWALCRSQWQIGVMTESLEIGMPCSDAAKPVWCPLVNSKRDSSMRSESWPFAW